MSVAFHDPVLRDEVVHYLVTDPTRDYVDATVGTGGHAEAICERLEAPGRLICFDADERALAAAKDRLGRFGERLLFVHSNFAHLLNELGTLHIRSIHGVLLDLGVSSLQLDDPLRGFSFREDERADMRMDQRQVFSARDVLNSYGEQELLHVLWTFGEERHARRIVRKIIASRPVETTGALRAIVESVVGQRFLTKSLARVFQAVRIEVNAELKNLERVLQDAPTLLSPGGRIVVLSYHSVEDRVVKEFFKRQAATTVPSGRKELPPTVVEPRLRVLTKKPITPTEPEMDRNPRARSAKLRVAERLPYGATYGA
jgi:16S rRNA (cytosine1402-N4)-methyltransferase